MSDQELAIREQSGELTVAQVIGKLKQVQMLMREAMVDGEDYGVIPGTKKPTLLKPGAEKLLLMFRLDPEYTTVEQRDGDHLTVRATCTLWHIPTNARMGAGMGMCSTRETKYAYRWEGYGNQRRQVENDALPDSWNTVVKMANKRALVAAILNVTGASQIFTQDTEDNERPAQPQPVRSAEPAKLKATDKAPAHQMRMFFDSIRTKFHCDETTAKLKATGYMHDVGVLDSKKLTIGDLEKMMVKLMDAVPEPEPDPFAGDANEQAEIVDSFDKAHPVDE